MAGRRWVFTCNNYEEEHETALKGAVGGDVRYLYYGHEVGESGTPHLQGFFCLSKLFKLPALKKRFGNQFSFQAMRGTVEDNVKYCGKQDKDAVELGDKPKPGTRTDLHPVVESLAGGASIKEMLLSGAIASGASLKFAEAAAKYVEAPRDWATEVIWIWGDSGAGKSRKARELAPRAYVKAGQNAKWWDGYDGHENVIIDDFRDSSWPLLDTLAVLDRYEHRVELKGGMRQLCAKRIVVTSIFPPQLCYKEAKGEPQLQLLRRITEVIHLASPVTQSVTEAVTEVGGNTEPQPI